MFLDDSANKHARQVLETGNKKTTNKDSPAVGKIFDQGHLVCACEGVGFEM